MNRKVFLFLLSMLAASAAQAQMYKWVDASGKVTYSDRPSPDSARQSQMKAGPAAYEGAAALPYSLATISHDHPVVLYASSSCEPCDKGRELLKKRGIPFSEKTVSTHEDLARLKQAGGDGRLPYFTVGRNGIAGFDAGSWNNALTAVGYPESSRLPSNYRQPHAQPAAPLPAPASAGVSGAASDASN